MMMERLRMYRHSTNGCLITFCGLDGCGKTTMIKRLTERLEDDGIPVMLTKQPTEAVRRSDIFRTYMDMPDHSEYEYRSLSLLAASDRVQHVSKVILPALNAGKTVICDRYFYSCLANLCARGYEGDKWIYEISESIIEPDAAFFLDVPVETAISRVRARESEKNRFIDTKLQYRLRDFYIAEAYLNRGILLSTTESEEKTAHDVYLRAAECIKRRKNDGTQCGSSCATGSSEAAGKV